MYTINYSVDDNKKLSVLNASPVISGENDVTQISVTFPSDYGTWSKYVIFKTKTQVNTTQGLLSIIPVLLVNNSYILPNTIISAEIQSIQFKAQSDSGQVFPSTILNFPTLQPSLSSDGTTGIIVAAGVGMLTSDYANGSGQANTNKVDHAIYADSATTAGNATTAGSASSAAVGSALETSIKSKADKTYSDSQLALKRDKAILIEPTDISSSLQQQIAGTAPVANSIPANSSVTMSMLTQSMIDKIRTNPLMLNAFRWEGEYTLILDKDINIYGAFPGVSVGIQTVPAQTVTLDTLYALVYIDTSLNTGILIKVDNFTLLPNSFYSNPNNLIIAIRQYALRTCFYEAAGDTSKYVIADGSIYIKDNKVCVSDNAFFIAHGLTAIGNSWAKLPVNSDGITLEPFDILVARFTDVTSVHTEIMTWNAMSGKEQYYSSTSCTDNIIPLAYMDITNTVKLVHHNDPTPRLDALETVSAVTNYWTGKKIVWFGTSIPAEPWPLRLNSSYPTVLGNLLGATVYNEAVGSSCVKSGVPAFVSADDPYGWTGWNWENAGFALSGTLTEKEELITNWDSKWKARLTGTADITMAEWASTFRDCSYENKLVAKHLGANRADLYVFDHGHNDLDANISVMPSNTRDRMYFLGAMNFLIDKILADNPRARICFIGHYENARKAEISQAQIILAEYWDFPLFHLWEKLGFSQQVITTTGYWGTDGLWVESGGTSQNLTMTQMWLKDDLHPSSDFGNKAVNLIAQTIHGFMNTVR
jgi:hypothetical protein